MDSAKPHGNFAAKFDLPFTLVVNPNKQNVSAYGMYAEKKNYYGTLVRGHEEDYVPDL